jgi:uncharacterized protein YkwD
VPRPVVAVRRIATAVLIAAAVAPAGASAGTASAAASCPGADQVPGAATLKQARAATLCLINRERARRGLGLLRSRTRLRKAATRHSRNMVRDGFFDHSSPTGSTAAARVRAAGYLRGAARFQLGENIGAGQSVLGTPAAMVEAWMHSPGHRSNILHASFRDIGIGIAAGSPLGGDGATYTTDFGVRH